MTDVGDEWAKGLVHTAAFRHVAIEPACTGYTLASSGRTTCGLCGWQLSARLADVGGLGSARFAFAALAQVGETVELVIGAVVTALFAAVGFEP